MRVGRSEVIVSACGWYVVVEVLQLSMYLPTYLCTYVPPLPHPSPAPPPRLMTSFLLVMQWQRMWSTAHGTMEDEVGIAIAMKRMRLGWTWT